MRSSSKPYRTTATTGQWTLSISSHLLWPNIRLMPYNNQASRGRKHTPNSRSYDMLPNALKPLIPLIPQKEISVGQNLVKPGEWVGQWAIDPYIHQAPKPSSLKSFPDHCTLDVNFNQKASHCNDQCSIDYLNGAFLNEVKMSTQVWHHLGGWIIWTSHWTGFLDNQVKLKVKVIIIICLKHIKSKK